MSMHNGDDESVEVSSLPSSRSIALGSGAESNPPTGDLEQLSEVAPSSSSSSSSSLSSDKKKRNKLVILGFLLIAALAAAAISVGVGVGSSSNSSANKSTSTAAALGEFVTYDASSLSSSKIGKSGDSKSSYSRSGTSSTKSPTQGPTADPTSSCPDGSSTDEGEECRTSRPDDFNGGCDNGGLYLGEGQSGFTNITFGESICGTASNYEFEESPYADQDWYYFKVSTDTTVLVRLTADFDAFLILWQLDDVDPCSEQTSVALTTTDVGDNTYVISSKVLQPGNYAIVVSSQSRGDSSLYCPTPGNYTLTLIDESIP